ncbi:MAG: hypothetical protein ACYDC1_00075 [Limisphaerales bacterium]
MRIFKVIALVMVVSVAGLYGLVRYIRPFGFRTCFLPCMVSSLYSYAHENSDMYPDNPDPYFALQMLYPQMMPNPELLAGISGDRKATTQVLASGGRLTSNECSWVYIPGLSTTNDANTIMLYERRSGLSFNGGRVSGRAVGRVDGSHRQMPEACLG